MHTFDRIVHNSLHAFLKTGKIGKIGKIGRWNYGLGLLAGVAKAPGSILNGPYTSYSDSYIGRPWALQSGTVKLKLYRFKRVAKLLKTYHQFTKKKAKQNVCMISAYNNNNNRAKKTQITQVQVQHHFKAHHMRALFKLDCNSRNNCNRLDLGLGLGFGVPPMLEGSSCFAIRALNMKNIIKKNMINMKGSPLTLDFQWRNLRQKHLFKSALGTLCLPQTSRKEQGDFLFLHMGALIFIKHRTLFMHFSELQQSGYLQTTPFVPKETMVLCYLVRSRLNYELKALFLKTAQFTQFRFRFLYQSLYLLFLQHQPTTY
jgi:hypothetical protein